MFLVDTNVVSELRKVATGKAAPGVTAWSERTSAGAMFLSAITVLELELGVLGIERRDPASGAVLRAWLETRVLPAFDQRILPVDVDVARNGHGWSRASSLVSKQPMRRSLARHYASPHQMKGAPTVLLAARAAPSAGL